MKILKLKLDLINFKIINILKNNFFQKLINIKFYLKFKYFNLNNVKKK